jgi:teichoic acid transport system permease protein
VTATSTQPTGTTDGAALAATWGLERVGRKPTLRRYVGESWRRRHFATELAKSRVIAASAENRLGILWELLNPILLACVYYFAFGVLLNTKSDSSNFVMFLLCGVLGWYFLNRSIRSGSSSVTANRQLVRSLHFPRLLLPVSIVLRQTLGFYSSLLVLAVIGLITREGIRWQWVFGPLDLILMAAFASGAAMLAARGTSRWRDLHDLLPFALRMWMYFAGVFFSVEVRYAGQPQWIQAIAFYNPAAVYLEIMRYAFMAGPAPIWLTWFWAVIWAVGFLILGTIVFWSGEESYGNA